MKTHPVFEHCQCHFIIVERVTVRWYRYNSVPSTMDRAASYVKSSAAPWTVVSADTQTEGRGTKGRSWYSPGGKGFWISVILPVPEHLDDVANVTILAAEALTGCLDELTGLRCAIKPPNDVTVGGKKIAGILVESQTSGERPEYMILGMGLNLRETVNDFVRADLPEATSLIRETGTIPDDKTILKCFLGHLIRRFHAAYGSCISSTGESGGIHP
ncbi:biotin--[acetyl-CoA-carboxylase] ligase [Candidatus Latescibacterota bacterium]